MKTRGGKVGHQFRCYVGVIRIMVIAIQNGDIVWGILGFFCGIVAIIYAVQHMDECKVPLGLLVLGIVGNVIVRVAAAGI